MKFTQMGDPSRAHFECILLKMFIAQNVEHGKSGSTSDRVTAERAEKLYGFAEGSSDLRGGDYGRQRKSVADGFAEDNDVGNNALRLETPEMRAEAAKTDLNFIGDADTAKGAHVFVDFG